MKCLTACFLFIATSLSAQTTSPHAVGSGQISKVSGNGDTLATVKGNVTASDCAQWDAFGNLVDGSCSGGAAPVTATAAGQTPISTAAGTTYAASSYAGLRTAPNINVVFDGDSLTVGTGTVDPTTNPGKRWATILLTYPEWAGRVANSYNTAISGQTCAQRLAAYTTDVHPNSPAVTGIPSFYFLWVGTNDIGVSTPAALYTCVSSLWTDARTDGFTVVASTLHSTGNKEPSTIGDIKDREAFNALVRQAGPLPTTYDYLMEPDEVFNDSHDLAWMQPDFIHPGQTGNRRFASYVNGLIWTNGATHAPKAAHPNANLGSNGGNWRDNEWSLFALTSGAANTALGLNNLPLETSGSNNTVVGEASADLATTAAGNTVVGRTAGNTCTTCSESEAIGHSADLGSTVAGAAQMGTGTNSTSNTFQFQTWNFLDNTGNAKFNLVRQIVGTAVASASTIAPLSGITHITGTVTINTITVPTVLGTAFTGCIELIADGAWPVTQAGNIASPTFTAVATTPYWACYDGTKWYIK